MFSVYFNGGELRVQETDMIEGFGELRTIRDDTIGFARFKEDLFSTYLYNTKTRNSVRLMGSDAFFDVSFFNLLICSMTLNLVKWTICESILITDRYVLVAKRLGLYIYASTVLTELASDQVGVLEDITPMHIIVLRYPAWKIHLVEQKDPRMPCSEVVSVYIRREQGLLHFTLNPCASHPVLIPAKVIPLKTSVGFPSSLTFGKAGHQLAWFPRLVTNRDKMLCVGVKVQDLSLPDVTEEFEMEPISDDIRKPLGYVGGGTFSEDALRGLVENEKDLVWTLPDFDGVHQYDLVEHCVFDDVLGMLALSTVRGHLYVLKSS